MISSWLRIVAVGDQRNAGTVKWSVTMEHYRHEALQHYATELLRGVGYPEEPAQATASHLVAADVMGHTTHGLALLPPYLTEADEGRTTLGGSHEVVSDAGAVCVWDGGYRPGVWLTAQAVASAAERAAAHGVGIVSIRRCSHIGCLATYLEAATDRGLMVIVSCSDPSVESVAPYGGTRAVYTPNPIAFGIPTADSGAAILVDISASITTNGMAARLAQQGGQFPGAWLQDAAGNPTSDPAAMTPSAFGRTGEATGTILPVGGVDHGHKGFGLGLAIEALTQGLSGLGRDGQADQWGCGVFVQALDPDRFAGAGAFLQATAYLAQECRTSPAAPWSEGVRIPGDGARAHRAAALADGVPLSPGIMEGLAPWTDKLSVAPPAALG